MIILGYPLYDIDGWQGNVSDDFGVDWIITGEDGWSSPPDAQVTLGDRPSGDGADDAPTYESPRTITLSGTAIAPNWLEQNRAKDRLNSAAYTSRNLYTLTVAENHVTRMAQVRRSGSQKISDRAGNAFDFQLSFIAPDPRKWSVNETTAGVDMPGRAIPSGRSYPRTYPIVYPAGGQTSPTVIVTNLGNRDSSGVVTFSGGIDQPGVVNASTGAIVKFDLSLGATDTLEVDLGNQTVMLNGTASRRSSLMAGSSWFALPPGDTRLLMTGNPNGTNVPNMTVRYRSAWK